MKIRFHALLTALLVLTLVLPAFPQAKQRKKPAAQKIVQPETLEQIATHELNQDEAIVHVLNRLGYGPRPGDVERVREMGLEKYIEQQLNPAGIDDSASEARLKRYATLAKSSGELMQEFPQPAQAAKKLGISPEEYRRRLEEQQAQRQQGIGPGAQMNQMGPQRIVAELALAKLSRAIYSDRQLEEQLTDFWFNHFNVFAQKGQDRYLLTSYENNTIRPRVLGRFRDLLQATAEDPAMLFYLDNFQSVDPKAAERLAAMRPFARPNSNLPPPPRGLNENYARELMELHTLGVDGGYTQQDVIQVARAFTGWGILNIRQPAFAFHPRLHDPDPKTVLGVKIDTGGKRDGEEVLDVLAFHPNTAKFISTKLARRFVSDNPPQALVDRMAATFLKTGGDIRQVMRTMIWSPEFWSRETYRGKIKKPFELVASAVRAVGAEMEVPLPLVNWTDRIGEPLYRCQPPTGYSDKAEAWVNTGALLNRMNFAVALTSNRLRGVTVDLNALLGDPSDLSKAVNVFLAGQLSPQTRQIIESQLQEDKTVSLAGLVLGSPEFQRR
jgi:uncharacterized protein (DUF1800 family)